MKRELKYALGFQAIFWFLPQRHPVTPWSWLPHSLPLFINSQFTFGNYVLIFLLIVNLFAPKAAKTDDKCLDSRACFIPPYIFTLRFWLFYECILSWAIYAAIWLLWQWGFLWNALYVERMLRP